MAGNHNDDVYYQRGRENLEGDKEIPVADRKAILEFAESCLARGVSYARARKYVSHLHHLKQFNGGGFSLVKATKRDLEKVLGGLERSDYSPKTKSSFKQAIKKFYTDHLKKPTLVSWIKTSIKRSQRYLPEDLLTEEERVALYAAAVTLRDKAILAILDDGGLRPGELVALRYQDVEEAEHGISVRVSQGKTGARRVLIIEHQKEVRDWKAAHPFKQKDAPLFPQLYPARGGAMKTPLGYKGLCHLLKNLGERAGISKSINPYLLRHTCGTRLASFMTESQLQEYLGWVPGSAMAGTYVHLSGKSTDGALLQHYNIAKGEAKGPTVCPRCSETNPAGRASCLRCGLPFNLKTVYEDSSQRISELEAEMEKVKARARIEEVLLRVLSTKDPSLAETIKKELEKAE